MKYFTAKCAECGKEIPVGGPTEQAFCTKQCETNYKWRRNSFGATQTEHSWDKDKVKHQ